MAIDKSTEPALLAEHELRHELANLHQIVQEADVRDTTADLLQRAKTRLRQLNIEYRRRVASAGY
jgi:hypothetical protein